MNPGDPLDPFSQMMNPMNPASPFYPHVVGGQRTRRIPDGQALALLLAGFGVAAGLFAASMWLIVR